MNTHASEPFIACFAPEAVVQDEGHTHRGHGPIRAWIENAFAKYRPILAVESVVEDERETVISGQVSGTFDGSPITLHYHLTFQDGKIATLRCEA